MITIPSFIRGPLVVVALGERHGWWSSKTISCIRMCDHAIYSRLQLADRDPLDHLSDHATVMEAYDLHAAAVHGTLIGLIGCERCAGEILAHSFLTECSKSTAPPALHQWLRSALRCSCEALDEEHRPEMRDRIRKWFAAGRTNTRAEQTVPAAFFATPQQQPVPREQQQR
jgi:hypothetical protein